MKAISNKTRTVALCMWLGAFVAAVAGTQIGFVSKAYAAIVNSIDVRGNQRVSDQTIIDYLTIKPGRSFSESAKDDGVKRLFGTGLFSDVRIYQSGSTLIVEVDEHAIVNQVIFQGNRKIKDNVLAQRVQLKPRGIYSESALDFDIQAIRDAYSALGRSDVQVTTRIVDLGENRVNVVFEINEGGRTKIDAINFVGNSAFSDRRLRTVISTKRSNYLSAIFRGDVFGEDKLRADEETLRRFYFDKGYADFQIVSSEANLDESTNKYSITITVDEGPKYTFGEIAVDSTIPDFSGEELQRRVATRSGRRYSATEIEESIVAITEYVAGRGFAFAQVQPRGERNFENRTISILYTVDQGPRTYIERIEIRGNNRTRDYVIRREFDVSEGDAFNQVLVQRGKKRLDELGFFDATNVSTVPGSQPDQVVLLIDVLEKSTGEFGIGAGYTSGTSDNSGVNLEVGITERNFLGRGQFVRASVGGSTDSRTYNLSFTEPYFLGRRIAAGFDIFRRTNNFDNYDSELTGGTIRFGLPITDNLSARLAYNYTRDEYQFDNCDDPNTCVAQAIRDAIETSPWVKSSLSASLTYSNIDDPNNPHEGFFATGTVEWAGLGGDAKYLALTGRATAYHTLSEAADVVGLLSVGAGHIEATGGESLRAFDLFRSSTRFIRGFEFNGIGPIDGATGDQLGGNTYFHATAEVQFPMPLIPENIGLRGALFADAATLYGNDLVGATETQSSFRTSVGGSIIWASPFGPLRADYAEPIDKESFDDVRRFSFGIATRF